MAYTPEDFLQATAALVAEVPGVDPTRVYTRRREVKDEGQAYDRWYSVEQNRVNAWGVTLQDDAVRAARGPGFSTDDSHTGQVFADIGIAIEGVFSINDDQDSETEFRALCWSVFSKINGRGKVHAGVVHQDACNWERFGYMVLAGQYFVHFARLTFRVTGQVYP